MEEFRFLRTELSLSQASLAHILAVKELTVGRWEKSETEIPLATDAVLRKMYSDTIVGKKSETMRQLLERIADLEEAIDEKVIKLGSNQEWKITKKAS
jgi:transcriptional regulator with XRE-family HTH domain